MILSLPAHAALSVRLQLGIGDTASTAWDGNVTASGARITALEPWRFDGDDALLPNNHWKASTHQIRIFMGARAPKRPFVANGVVVTLDGDPASASLEVHTPQGNFTVRMSEIPYGTAKSFLDGKALADRVPAAVQLTNVPKSRTILPSPPVRTEPYGSPTWSSSTTRITTASATPPRSPTT